MVQRVRFFTVSIITMIYNAFQECRPPSIYPHEYPHMNILDLGVVDVGER